MKFDYPKNEKLKSHNTISLLFSEGKSVSKYPLRLVYVENPSSKEKLQMGVSVSKKYFKKAVDRNRYKRLLRECYRLNKHMLLTNIESPYAIMFFYQTKEKLTFEEIHEKTISLFEKFLAQLKQ